MAVSGFGCSKKADVVRTTSYLGHFLGESPMIWSVEENQAASDPLEVCKDIVKSGVNQGSDEYKQCRDFVRVGNYGVRLTDWRLKKTRLYTFTAWKLSGIAAEFPKEQEEPVRKDLTTRFGAPADKDAWRGPDGASIRIFSDAPALSGDGSGKDEKTILVFIVAR
jgi:hypothetical protein